MSEMMTLVEKQLAEVTERIKQWPAWKQEIVPYSVEYSDKIKSKSEKAD